MIYLSISFSKVRETKCAPLSQIRHPAVIRMISLADRTLTATNERGPDAASSCGYSSGEFMKVRTILLGAAACAVISAPAFAKETTEQRLERMERIIEQQQQEISDLKAQQAAQAATPAPAPEVAEQPASQADVEALQNQVYEQAAANKSGWWSNTKISGRMYYDISYVNGVSRNAPSGGNPSGHTYDTANGANFDIKRFYLGVDHTFDDMFSANLTTDFTFDSTTKASQIYLKKAYLQAKLDDALIFRLGSADLPWVPFVEDTYGYRYVENVMIDRTKFGTSADWGVHMLGKLADGLINYQISAVNGAGYKASPTNPTNRSGGIDVEGRVNLNYEGFILALGGYHGQLGKGVVRSNPTLAESTTHTANRLDVLGAYQMDPIRFGVEYFYTDDWNSVTSTGTDKARGVSVFGSYQFDPEWGVFGRYDWVNPTAKNALGVQTADVKDKYFNVGISYSPAKIVDFSLVYKHEQTDDGTISTSNGTIGGAIDGNYNEVGLFGQFRW